MQRTWVGAIGDDRDGREGERDSEDAGALYSIREQEVQGVDVWINTTRRPWEAYGTSGMQARQCRAPMRTSRALHDAFVEPG
jgi:hypothetical protein